MALSAIIEGLLQAQSAKDRFRGRMKKPSWRNVLDALTSVVLLSAAGVVLWNQLRSPSASLKREALKPPKVPLTMDLVHFSGRTDARIGVVVFSEFQCPYCSKFSADTLPLIRSEYVDTGKVRFGFHSFPLDSIHALAAGAAQAAECAGQKGKFWEFHDSLFADQKRLERASLLQRAGTLGLDVRGFEACLDGPTTAVDRSRQEAKELGIRSTPTTFVGTFDSNGRLAVKTVVAGAAKFSEFQAAIDKLLR